MSMIITAKDNDKIKYTKSLLKSKNRNKESKFIIEGYRILTLAIECRAKLDYVFINEDFEKKQEHKEFLETLKKKDIRVYKTTNKIFEDLTDTENTQGIIGVVKFKQRTLEENLTDDNRFVLILDRIQDPGNMGTIIRTADAVGAHGVIIPKRRSVHITPVVAKASAGAVEYVPVCKVTNIVNTIKKLKDEGLWIAAADMDGQTFYEQNLTGALGLVIGSEGFGISRLVKQNCDFTVKMPMIGNVTSLNASVAAGILLYEIFKQRSGNK